VYGFVVFGLLAITGLVFCAVVPGERGENGVTRLLLIGFTLLCGWRAVELWPYGALLGPVEDWLGV
jgi:hypothetical protein